MKPITILMACVAILFTSMSLDAQQRRGERGNERQSQQSERAESKPLRGERGAQMRGRIESIRGRAGAGKGRVLGRSIESRSIEHRRGIERRGIENRRSAGRRPQQPMWQPGGGRPGSPS